MHDILAKLDEDIRLRGLSEETHRAYTHNAKRYVSFLGDKPIEETTEVDVRRFSAYLCNERHLAPRTINNYLAGVTFLYEVTLDRELRQRQVPRMKVPKSLPEILSRQQLTALFENTTNLKHKALFSLGYGCGLRVSEVCSLRVCDIDSQEMRLFVRAGKGNKDRYTVLPEATLNCLREYWKAYRPQHPEGFLFTGVYNLSCISSDACNSALKTALRKIDIEPSGISFHVLRHCFATHMLEDGTDIVVLKNLLGHQSLSSTMTYLHLVNTSKGLVCPINKMSMS